MPVGWRLGRRELSESRRLESGPTGINFRPVGCFLADGSYLIPVGPSKGRRELKWPTGMFMIPVVSRGAPNEGGERVCQLDQILLRYLKAYC
jgi:hypothetical protein